MTTNEITTNEQIIEEFETFWHQINKPQGSVYKEYDEGFINGLRKNFHDVHHAELDEEKREYFSSLNGKSVIMGYALSVRDLLEIIGLDFEIYDTHKKQVEGHECKGIQICFGHNHKQQDEMKTVNAERLELIMRPLLYEANDKPMANVIDTTYWCTTYSGNPNETQCPPPLDHCKSGHTIE